MHARSIAATIAFIACGATSAFDRASAAEPLTLSFPDGVERVWVGPELWANRLQDWRVSNGRLECFRSADRYPMRTVHLLTRRLGEDEGDLSMSVRTGAMGDRPVISPTAATGFLLGAGGGEMDHRAAAIIHHSHGRGAGLFAGIDGLGRAVIFDFERQRGPTPPERGNAAPPPTDEVLLRVAARPVGDGYTIRVISHDPASDRMLSEATLEGVPPHRLIGNVALVSHPGQGPDRARFWFDDWRVGGSKLEAHKDRTAGPILSAQHTLSRGVLKLTAQLMPIAHNEPHEAFLQIERDGAWTTLATAPVIVPGWTATFRIRDWHQTRDTPYRVAYEQHGGTHTWSGTIRRDPADKSIIVIAAFTGNHNCRHGMERPRPYDWPDSMWFPHADLTASVQRHEPDLLFFSGDQVYEGASPTHAVRIGHATIDPNRRREQQLDYLYKWYLWCWAYRDLARDIPTIAIPDDHDVYQGNIWGQGGRPIDKDDKGGYVEPAEFVNMVQRTQTSNLPPPHDPAPIEQGITVYYTDLLYGGVSFAVLEDRKFKTGPNGKVPDSGSDRADHITDPDFDVSRADRTGFELLGERQEAFLRDWAHDYRGAVFKVALSQTGLANLATHHGGGLQYLRADLDSNGWPQSGRNRALDLMRRGFAFHIGGDQHLATVTHHGIDAFGDAIWSFVVPSIANFYPRAWAPKNPGPYAYPAKEDYTGDFRDGLGNRVTVCAATNPGRDMGHEPEALHNGMAGYGIVKLDKRTRKITMECWPRFADPETGRQYKDWPITIHQRDNYGRAAAAHLPTIRVTGMRDPVVRVVNESDDRIVYTLRIQGDRFRPKVFDAGAAYTLHIGEPGTERMKTLRGLRAAEDAEAVVDVAF